jgi:predicted amidohydrolase YtcJ
LTTIYTGDTVKKLVALDTIKKSVVELNISDNKLLVEPCLGRNDYTHVLTRSHHDSHTHPMLFSMFFGALNPIMLNESTDKKEIMEKLRERKGEGPIVAYEYKMTADITAEELDEFKEYVLLVDSSFHGGVANSRLLNEVMRRKNLIALTGWNHRITEDNLFTALGILEEQVAERGVEEAMKWVKSRLAEGTTSFEEKIIFTETEWDVLKEVAKRLASEAGYQPITAVYVKHSLFIKNPRKYVEEGEQMGIPVGVKWVCDGALGSKTAALESYSFADGTTGMLTLPVSNQNGTAVPGYIGYLIEEGVDRLSCHAIGDRAIGIVLDMAPQFQDAGLMLSIEHFELPTYRQIARAAELGVPLNMQLNYSTEVWRYASWMGGAVNYLNPVRAVLDAYDKRGHKDLIKFGTDGMPQSMLWAMACGVQHPIGAHRISLTEAIEHSKDPEGLLVLEKETFKSLTSMDLKAAAENREASAAELHKGIVLVARDGKILHSTL